MSEPENKTVPETPAPEANEPQYTEVEVRAMEQGWRPKEDWVANGGDEAEWRSAREFIDRGELLNHIHGLKRQNQNLSRGMTALQRHHQHVFEMAHQKAVNDLKMQRRQAVRAEDIEVAEQIDEQIEELQQDHAKARQEMIAAAAASNAATSEPPVEFQSWVARNPWYTTDEELKDEADSIGMVYFKKNPNATPDRVMKHVEETIKKRHAERFGGTRRAAPSPVAPVDRTNKGKRTDSGISLSAEEEKVMNDLVRSGTMTKEEYIAELKKAGR